MSSIHRARGGHQKGGHAPFQPPSDHQKSVFLDHYRETKQVSASCKAAGMSRAQFNHTLATDPDFVSEQHAIDEFFLDKLEDVANLMAFQKDGAMVRWLLEKQRPDKFGQKSKMDVTHKFGSPDDVKKLTDEELEAQFDLLGIEFKNTS